MAVGHIDLLTRDQFTEAMQTDGLAFALGARKCFVLNRPILPRIFRAKSKFSDLIFLSFIL